MSGIAEDENWFSVTVFADREAETAIESAFNLLDCDGIEVDALRKTRTDQIRVVGYFKNPPSEPEVRRVIDESLDNHSVVLQEDVAITIDSVKDQDWLAEWKKHWKPTTAGGFVIVPPWEEVPEGPAIPIIIEPAMAFGTGTHETTRLCLEFITELYKPGMSFLDVGTGTGILSIAAAKMAGHSRAEMLAVDVDADSIEIAKENARLNSIEGVKFQAGSIEDSTQSFDFVCANMTIDIILPMLDLLCSKSSGPLILSGILAEQEDEIRNALEGLYLDSWSRKSEGEWIALALFC